MLNGDTLTRVAAYSPDRVSLTEFSLIAGNSGNAFSITPNGVIKVNDASQLKYNLFHNFTLIVSVSGGGM